jgi:hypothetical protein
MQSDATTFRSRDILASPWRTLLVFCLPAFAVVVAGALNISIAWRTAVWVVALLVMGSACLVNAFQCGRVHCYLTGPFFLLMGVVTLLYGLGVISLAGNGWNLLGLIILVGAIALSCLPEMLFGKYRPPTVLN